MKHKNDNDEEIGRRWGKGQRKRIGGRDRKRKGNSKREV